MVKLGDILSIIRGVTFKPNDQVEPLSEGSTIVMRTKNVQRSGLDTSDLIAIPDSFIKRDEQYLRSEDMLISSANSWELVGKISFIDKLPAKSTAGGFISIIRAKKEKVIPKYLYYWLTLEHTQVKIRNCGQKTTNISNLNLERFKELFIPLPSLNDQRRIVAILDKAANIRQKREQAIKLSDDFLRATFLEMFGTPANNIHRFPTGKIRDLVDSVNYGTSAKASIDSGEYPILRMGNITYQGRWDFTDLKYLDLSVKEKDKFLVKEGDLLFNRTNSKELVGKTAVYEENRPMAFAGYLIRVRPNPIGNNYYISGYLNSIHGKITLMNMCKSIVGMANINAQELQNIEILIPPKHLQDEYEIIYKKIKKGLSIYDKSAMQLQLLASNLSNEYFM
ncbi:TPA_asm: restriction endonuclease [Salmonella enterica subsp. enterica serovar Typhi str. CT18]|uniref:Restriction endonuclease n=1 Tax=Salmonella enterica subsp. enterica serovar Typhi str. CT18 TaxID=220341 RepID=A0A715AW61_SALTI|nr:restriction endonuclease [Salmonella enterica]EBV3514873.1 restriction endonuclease [Salmonella enterica subsp. enterica serovar Typhi]HAD4182316.1 restriction endonuclease [Salmonella enterica subsp. enterica serovar Typhi str. CT18]ECA6113215.1 restriction endonuclease [Salmonella enterica subsp. enterica serovar Typhi]ECB6520427.1 restriction endonuclease [Salmonella enterica subsp. enterica serovar Typhi]